LFLRAQFTRNPSIQDLDHGIPPGLRWSAVFALILGFVGGLTLELLYGKLQQTDVTSTQAITANNL